VEEEEEKFEEEKCDGKKENKMYRMRKKKKSGYRCSRILDRLTLNMKAQVTLELPNAVRSKI
jgi:hypothetical protein